MCASLPVCNFAALRTRAFLHLCTLFCSVDDDGPQLYQVDPSGAYFGWRASAIGKNFTNAKVFLEKVCVCVCVCVRARVCEWLYQC
ncbi:hypothetical protein EON67_08365 [archaeon]|nr:MAG: hypothetical protein EON67_08365 [archaeon]